MGETTDDLRRDINERRQDISRDLDAIGDKVSPRQAARRTTDSARRRLHGVRDAVMGTASEGASAMSDTASAARDQLQQVPDLARRQTEGNPLAAGVVAFGAGMLVASLIKPSRGEQALASHVEPHLQQAASQLKEKGAEVAEQLEEPARQAAESAGQAAREAAEHVVSGSPGDAS